MATAPKGVASQQLLLSSITRHQQTHIQAARSAMSATLARLAMIIGLVVLMSNPVTPFCECGYTAQLSISGSPTTYTFTEVIESDFVHDKDIAVDTDWVRQNYTVTPPPDHRYYGMNFTVLNSVSNAIADLRNWTTAPVLGGDPGLRLLVAPGIPPNSLVPVAEVDSSRVDLLYGSYRFGVKVPSIAGTCTSVYFYHSESQEIDIEILSSKFDFKNKIFPVNLVMQSQQSADGIYNTVGNGNYLVANLSFDPTLDFHEYRIDFVPGNVLFYADDQIIGTMNSSSVPTQPGHLVLRHWSNGDTGWTYGPPLISAAMIVSYVKGYFNSADAGRQSAANLRCTNPAAGGAYCPIPGQPNPSLQSFFFSQQENMTKGQTVFGHNGVTAFRVGWKEMGWMMLGVWGFAFTVL